MRKPVQTSEPIHPLLAERWSPRSFQQGVELSQSDITALLEAARWAPSANNLQPWKFIVAKHGDERFESITASLAGFNKEWAPNAAGLVVACAEVLNEDGTARQTALYDLGLSVAFLIVEAQHRGLVTHQMAGFDKEIIAKQFEMPESLRPIVIVAIGKQAASSALSSDILRDREESPRSRKSIAEITL
jgi:nitroreductase